MQIRLKDEDFFGNVIFEVMNDESTSHKGLQYIFVEVKEDYSNELKFKKRIIIDYLLSLKDTNTSWREVDRKIETIMDARIHCL